MKKCLFKYQEETETIKCMVMMAMTIHSKVNSQGRNKKTFLNQQTTQVVLETISLKEVLGMTRNSWDYGETTSCMETMVTISILTVRCCALSLISATLVVNVVNIPSCVLQLCSVILATFNVT